MRLLVLILFLCLSTFAKEKITWIQVDLPPYMIANGKHERNGIGDIIVNKTIQVTSDKYENSINFISFKKLFKLLKLDKTYCTTALLKTEDRSKFISFSKPVAISLSHRLYVYRKSITKVKPFIEENGSIDLKKLLEQEDFTLGLTKYRRFGKGIDELVLDNKRVYKRDGEGLGEGILKMLISNRGLDATLIYPLEVDYFSKKLDINFNNLLIPIPIKKNLPIINIYIGCSKTTEGENFIKLINKNIEAIRYSAYNIEKYWYSKENFNELNPFWMQFFIRGKVIN